MWTIPLDPVGVALSFPTGLEKYSIARQLHRISYRQTRPFITEALLEARLQVKPELLEPWMRYSQDKRTSGGWYLLKSGDSWTVGAVGTKSTPAVSETYESGARAGAVFVLRELDFWEQVGRSSLFGRVMTRFYRLFG